MPSTVLLTQTRPQIPGRAAPRWRAPVAVAIAVTCGLAFGAVLVLAGGRVDTLLPTWIAVGGLYLLVATGTAVWPVRPVRRRLLWTGAAAVAALGAGVVAAVGGLPIGVVVQGGALAVAAAYLGGLLRDLSRHTAVTDLVAQLPGTPSDLVPDRLRAALHDPTVRIVRATADGRLVDAAGHPVDPGPAARTDLPRLGRERMVMLHDPTRGTEPAVLDAAAAAAAFALDNQLLTAEVRAQLVQVRASRARVVAAADESRRQIERDLHDGAQQHLVTVSLVLRMARDALAADAGPEAVDALLDRVADGLDAALVELRELARGIHPAVLTESGLLPALRALVARSVQAVDVVCPGIEADTDLPPLPAPIAATAYFVAAEAVTNAAKHAGAHRVHVQVRCAGARLLVTVVDDGVGGADAAPDRGSGLAGLQDRVAAVGGVLTVHSPPGAGTTVHADLPMDVPEEPR
ncbi:sensor histidine kinase [Pseudonocardia sp. CA-107938]|uniref:sensor histidine kinase n=1 Tax=Pseudonocardia sp. CA-107938 TaxID=3240021 RepID=UPI003D8D3AC0